MQATLLLPLLMSLAASAQPPGAAPAAAPASPRSPSSVPGMAPVPGLPNLLVSGVPEVPPELRRRAGQYLESRAASLQGVSEEGSQVLLSTRFGNVSQLHVVERPLGARTQVTFGTEPILFGTFLPGAPHTLLYLQDTGGAEFFQLFRFDRRSGQAERLTDGRSRNVELVRSENGRWLAWSSTQRNGEDLDVYVAPVDAPHTARRLTESKGDWGPVAFSRDGARLLVRQFRSVDDVDLHLVELKTGERRQLTPREGQGSLEGATFSADGRSIYFSTHRYGDLSSLYRLELDKPGAQPTPLAPSLRWSVAGLALAPDGRSLALHVNEDSYSKLYLLDTRSGRLTPLPVPTGVIGRVLFPGKRSDTLFFDLSTPRSPSDVWQLELRTRKLTRWTRSEVGGLNPDAFVEPELVRYPSTQGVSVPALLYLPPKAQGGRPHPVVVIFHGGPEAQNQPEFYASAQFLAVELGMAVLLPNVRGSDGYGKAFRAMDNGVKREQSLADIGATLDFIASRKELDASRVGVYGGSYGGYLVLATAAYFPERIRAAVDVVGISSIPTFLESTQAYRRDLRRAEYGDERDPQVRAVQERISPLYAVDRMKAALFVLQGANDPRVPQSEAEQVVQAVRARGSEAWYLLALDEGHGFAKKPNRDMASLLTYLFLERHLGASSAVPAGKAQ